MLTKGNWTGPPSIHSVLETCCKIYTKRPPTLHPLVTTLHQFHAMLEALNML